MSEILTSIIKEITSDVTIDSIPAITPQQKVTAEFVNAVNQGFKLGINGNFKLIKAHNGLHIDTLSGKEFSGKSRFVGVFENVNQDATIPEFEVNFGLVKFVDFNNENFWKDFLQDTILFVKVNNSNNGSILHLNCKFLIQIQTTDGDGDTTIIYAAPEKTVQLRLIKSDEEPYTVNNLIDKITPIKLSFDEIDSGIIKFNAQTTDDITVADLTMLWEEVNELNGKMTIVENELEGKVNILEATQLSAYVRYPYDEQGASLMPVDVSPTPVSLVMRNAPGDFEVNTPSQPAHPANKSYVDEQAEWAIQMAIDSLSGPISELYNSKGQPDGIAELDENGKVPSGQLPSYVDDVIEVSTFSALPETGENGKIYVTLDTNLTYRWGGSEYVEISKSLAIGETAGTAYRGDRGKVLYDFAKTAIVDGELKTQLAAKMNTSDRYLGWVGATVNSGVVVFDGSVSDKYAVELTADAVLEIVNVPDGFCGLIMVSPNNHSLTLPLNVGLNADFDYLNAESNQGYLYSFVRAGGFLIFNRTVVYEEPIDS